MKKLINRLIWLFLKAKEKRLQELLSLIPSNKDGLEAQTLWIIKLIEWIRSPHPTPAEFDAKISNLQLHRVQILLKRLLDNEPLRMQFAELIVHIMDQPSAIDLFSHSGLSLQGSLWGETIYRLQNRILPELPNFNSLPYILKLVFHSQNDVHWIENLSYEVFGKFKLVLNEYKDRKPQSSMAKYLRESVLSLSAEATGLGLGYEISSRLDGIYVTKSPFWQLGAKINTFILQEDQSQEYMNVLLQIEYCRGTIATVLNNLDEKGVSVNLVYRLDRLKRILDRIENIVFVLSSQNTMESNERLSIFVADLVRSIQQESSLRNILRDNLRLLSRRIVDRSGRSGEHYITHSRKEYWKMILGGAGGGLITALTTSGKLKVSMAHFPLFFEGFFNFTVYTLSFIVIQILGFTLATKQPAMTAAAIASKLRRDHKKQDRDSDTEVVQEIICIIRSQFASAFGNIFMVIPAAIGVLYFFDMYYEKSLITADYALHTLISLSPTKSLTVLFAAWTGVVLWLGSVFGGWVENWFVLQHIPEALAQNRRLNRIFGKRFCLGVAEYFSRNIAGFATSVALGFGLAFTPVYGKFMGIPMDVRHVTLSTGMLTLSAGVFGKFVDVHLITEAVIGIVIIGFFNFTVSFIISMFVAARAQDVSIRKLMSISTQVIREFFRSPISFLIPPKF